MVWIEVDGKRYGFDSYDDMEVSKQILEDILQADWNDQQLKAIRVVNTMRTVLDAGRSGSF